jgi:DNA-binding transcriptional regulator LsrR (DeoR family)
MTPEAYQDAYAALLAAKLSDLMAEHAVNQAELARRMVTNRATVCRMLQGGDARAGTWFRAFAALGYEIDLKRCA